jgi:hypothetical protein
MTLAQRKAIKMFILNLILLAFAVFIANNSLPPDKVAGYLHKNADTAFMAGHKETNILEQGYARWHYRSYGVVKYAVSDRLGVTLVGYPFQPWRIHKRH